MNDCDLAFYGARLKLRGSGALWWPKQGLLCVSDLHLGKSERTARRLGTLLPPYEGEETLRRLQDEIERTGARTVICLGDSFDDTLAAAALSEDLRLWIARLQAGRRWIWIEGNHDPGPVELGGSHHAEVTLAGLTFRHIAERDAEAEISGHYHPKARLSVRGRTISRKCFLHDPHRIILPAFGAYTGGLDWQAEAYRGLLGPEARATLTGERVVTLARPDRVAAP